MKFVQGMPRPANAGRKKGTGNKKKVKKAADYFAEMDICPAEEIYKIIRDGDLTEYSKAQLWMQLLHFTQTRPKEDDENDDEQSADLLDIFKDVSDATLLKLIPKKENV